MCGHRQSCRSDDLLRRIGGAGGSGRAQAFKHHHAGPLRRSRSHLRASQQTGAGPWGIVIAAGEGPLALAKTGQPPGG